MPELEIASAHVNIEAQNCSRPPKEPIYCPTDGVGGEKFYTNTGQYPRLFYLFLSSFVLPDTGLSIVLMRAMSGGLIALMLSVLMFYLPHRYRVVLALVILTTFSATGYFLFSSINPSSWTAFGVGVGWLAIHASVAPNTGNKRERILLMGLGLLAWLMACGSRWDSLLFVALSAVLIAIHVLVLRRPDALPRSVLSGVFLLLLLTVLLERYTFISPLNSFRVIYTYSPGQADNTAFISQYLLQGPTNAINALGSIPTMSRIPLPDVVFVLNVALLGFFVILSFTKFFGIQLFGTVAAMLGISITVMTWVSSVDGRDYGGIEPRYVVPLLMFAAGWWFLTTTDRQLSLIQRHLKSASCVASMTFGLLCFVVGERYVDVQSGGLRLIPAGSNQWWWPWLPIGPNVPMLLAPLCLWKFFSEILKTLERSKESHQQIEA